MNRLILTACAIVCAMALCIGGAVGCTPAASSLDSAQQEHSSYMSKVNALMNELGDELDSFVAAVSRNDLVNMRTQADNAYKTIDELSSLDVPEDLSDVHQKYTDGTAKLREALDEYITLFTEVSDESFDQSTYEGRIAEVQALYDEGVDLLKQGDEAAAAK